LIDCSKTKCVGLVTTWSLTKAKERRTEGKEGKERGRKRDAKA
jgi:hypothetical protein